MVTVASAISSAAASAANDTASNSSASFTVLQNAGLPAVTVNSPPKVNFAVFSDGAVKLGLTTTNVSFALAKLVPGANGNPDQWVSYIYRTETATAGVGPNGAPKLATAKQATTDTKAATQLVYNPDGYYTYTFSTDIKDSTKTNGVVFEPNLTHRIAIQLSYTNKAGATVRVNPYFDFTVDANGNAVAVDAGKTRKMVDIATCNGCHNKLAFHGGGRIDTQFCVMCHNSGTTDANSGNVLDLRTMAHKIHFGRHLKERFGEDYTIWGYRDTKYDYAEVGFPQDPRNCATCHSAAIAGTPQGDNWKSKPSKEACMTCHKSGTGSNWDSIHVATLKLGATAAAVTHSTCASCHGSGTQWVRSRCTGAGGAERQELPEQHRERHLEDSTHRDHRGRVDGHLRHQPGHRRRLTCGRLHGRGDQGRPGNSITSCNTNYRWSAVLPRPFPASRRTSSAYSRCMSHQRV